MVEPDIRHIVVAGAGLMGAIIAQSFPQYDVHTTIYSNCEDDFERARQIVANCHIALIENGAMTREESEKIQNALVYTVDTECFRDAQLVIEAIPESIDIKKAFYEMICAIVPDDCIIASNTSAISINELAKYVTYPERFCGTHYLNPAHIIPLVEITCGEQTAQHTVDKLHQVFTDMGKKPVMLKKDVKGFLSNRLQFALLREATYLVESGVATPEDIDTVLKYGNGLRYTCSGPFKIVDFGGMDVFNSVAKYLYPDLSDEKVCNNLLQEMVDADKHGISNGKGFYSYTSESAIEEEKERDSKMIKILHS
ncbi:MAG: 3-hydroxyacyl-CoA dehydrogenase NAD-binding domain-containing protein [Lachnospiraceae bacterium]|nr:3-hydroxyacyl-CoA dehydrogenase NAD-binding domain-containing protein [Lachnospiraceae bacterium]NCD03945.1 3-hydroxyacyl-CoA dehydrogenase family protein [Clostridia bacterium]